MPRTRPLSLVLSAAFLLAVLLALAGCGAPPADCSLFKVARLKLQMEHGLPLVAVAINGQPVWMVVDTGAERSVLTEKAVARLNLPHDVGHLSRTMGIGGPSSSWDVVVDSLVMGGVRFPVDRLAVANFTVLNDGGAVPAGLLGADILLAFDLDFDISNNALTLYRARRCPNMRPPWEVEAIPIPGVTARKDRVLLPFTLDGLPAAGLLDTGAQRTTIGSQLARRLGVTDETMANDPVIMQHGAGPEAIASHLHRFSSLAIGPARATNPALTVVSSASGVGDALIGQDFLFGRRVWISFATMQVFVTPLPNDAVLAPVP